MQFCALGFQQKGVFMEKIIPPFHVGDTVVLRKQHPCGGKTFRVMRTGSDIRIVCTTCGRDMTVTREKLERAIKDVIHEEKDNG